MRWAAGLHRYSTSARSRGRSAASTLAATSFPIDIWMAATVTRLVLVLGVLVTMVERRGAVREHDHHGRGGHDGPRMPEGDTIHPALAAAGAEDLGRDDGKPLEGAIRRILTTAEGDSQCPTS